MDAFTYYLHKDSRMLIINKENPTTRLIVTLSEHGVAGECDFVVHSDFNNVTTTYAMGENTSEHKQRYDEFIIPTIAFSALKPGKFKYLIRSGEVVLESGVLMVIDKIQTDEEKVDEIYTSITPVDTDDDYVVFIQ